MAYSVNKVTLLGNVGKDPEYRVIPSGAGVCNFTMATTESFKNSNDQWEDRTEWHNVECWRGLADTVNKYVKKGHKLYIEGRLRTESYEKDGITRYRTKIVANELIMLTGKDQAGDTGYSQNAGYTPAAASSKSIAPAANNNNEYSTDMESESWDDVPF